MEKREEEKRQEKELLPTPIKVGTSFPLVEKELTGEEVEKRELKNEVLKLVQTAGSLDITKKQRDVLFAPVKEEDVEIRPDGLIYLPWMEYVTRLQQAFDASWCILPTENPKLEGNLIVREYCLIVKGVMMGFAFGEQTYQTANPTMSWGDALEGCKSNALMRLCKGIGISLELWKPSFIRNWKKEYARSEWRTDKKTGKKREYWYKKGDVRQVKEEAQSAPQKDGPHPSPFPQETHPPETEERPSSPPGKDDKGKGIVSLPQVKRLYAMMKAAGLEDKSRLLKHWNERYRLPAKHPPLEHFSEMERWFYVVATEEIQQVIDKKAKKERTKTIEEGEKAYAEKQIPRPELSLEGSGWVDLGNYEKGDCEQE